MNINYIVRNYLLFFLFTVFFVIILIYAYPWLLSNSYFVIFELGGPVPLHSNIWLMNSYLSYFENLGVRGLYGIGWPSYVIIYILSLSSHIGGIGVGERLWLISDLLISFIFSYKLFRIAFKSKIIPYVNALAYTFSPAMAVLVYRTS